MIGELYDKSIFEVIDGYVCAYGCAYCPYAREICIDEYSNPCEYLMTIEEYQSMRVD